MTRTTQLGSAIILLIALCAATASARIWNDPAPTTGSNPSDMSENTTSPIPSTETTLEDILKEPTTEELRDIYRYRYQTGVNFGGPFVLERWMNGAVFEGISGDVGTSQDAFNRGVGDVDKLKKRLEDLWENYITECDMYLLSTWGINTIRLPVGYWIIGGKYPDVPMLQPFEPYTKAYEGAEDAVHKVFQTAEKYGLGVLLDLHGAPGSQNGADHSGEDGRTGLYGSEVNRRTTVATLKRFAEIYGNYTNLVGIELLNEPRDDPQLTNIYQDAYVAIREVTPDMPIYICDTVWTSNWNKWADFIVNSGWENAGLDVHKYYAFGGGGTPADSHINGIRTWERSQLRELNDRVPVIVGEWSNALNPGSYNGYDQQRQDGSRRNLAAQQLETLKGATGWHFWSYTTDLGVSDWDFKSLVTEGWLTGNFYPFPALRCPQMKRKIIEEAVEDLEDEVASGLASHQEYWRKENATGVYDWNMYQDGFVDGYTTAAKFFYHTDSRVASPHHLGKYKMKDYTAKVAKEGKSTASTWQYKDGFDEGVHQFQERLSRYY